MSSVSTAETTVWFGARALGTGAPSTGCSPVRGKGCSCLSIPSRRTRLKRREVSGRCKRFERADQTRAESASRGVASGERAGDCRRSDYSRRTAIRDSHPPEGPEADRTGEVVRRGSPASPLSAVGRRHGTQMGRTSGASARGRKGDAGKGQPDRGDSGRPRPGSCDAKSRRFCERRCGVVDPFRRLTGRVPVPDPRREAQEQP